MGRYLAVDEFFRFCDSGLLDYPNLYLEMSSASRPEVYARVLGHAEILDRLLFGSDLPSDLITGVEAGLRRGRSDLPYPRPIRLEQPDLA